MADRVDTESAPLCVLLATLASAPRAPFLRRALESIRAQQPLRTRAIVVANGADADPALLDELARRPDVTLLRQPEASLPAALALGRAAVDSPAFGQLDDDDELLPGALAARLARLQGPDRPDAVVTNGLVRGGREERESITDAAAVAAAPLDAMMRGNWLLPGAALFRTAAVDADLFARAPRYLEWTYVGLRLALAYRLAVLPQATVVHYEGLEFSVNDSRACLLGRPRAFARVLELPLPPRIRRALRRKRSAAWHQAAERLHADGLYRAAWAAHARSLAGPGGARYLAWTRYLFALRVPRTAPRGLTRGERP
jgi:glycosyltransferase involved in cell wall biosynthesis